MFVPSKGHIVVYVFHKGANESSAAMSIQGTYDAVNERIRSGWFFRLRSVCISV